MANITGSSSDAGRLIHIAKRRERHKEDIERQKQKITNEQSKVANISDKFATHYDAIEATLKSSTVGLVTLDQMKAKQEDYVKQRERQLAQKTVDEELEADKEAEEERKRIEREQQKRRVLSFDIDEQDDHSDAEPQSNSESSKLKRCQSPVFRKMIKISKNPQVDTSFLPDKQREEVQNKLREELRSEWAKKQEQIKNEVINIAVNYWDGSGHRRDLKMRKGNTVGQCLNKAIDVFKNEFHELKACSSDALMFIKEDLIIPHFYSFYDFIVTRAMGKTGPLFEFDAAGEIRVRGDAALDSGESHPAKLCLRSWFERNKHIYPASQWEAFDPNKKYNKFDELKGI